MEKTKVHKIHRRKERKYFKKQIESKKVHRKKKEVKKDMTHSQMLGKVEYGGGPIFKVVLEC